MFTAVCVLTVFVCVCCVVEVIRTTHTDPAIYDIVTEFGRDIGKTTVSCGDTPGFIVNRLLIPYLTSAMEMLDRGDASGK